MYDNNTGFYQGWDSVPDPVRDKRGQSYSAVLSYYFTEEDTDEQVTLQEAKDWCAIDGCDYDMKMSLLIKAARKKVEKAKQISLINRTVTARVNPGTPLPYGPVKSLTSITDAAGNTYKNLYDCNEEITAVYTAGPGENGLSEDLKVEILQQVAFMLENRGDATTGTGGISPMIKGNAMASQKRVR